MLGECQAVSQPILEYGPVSQIWVLASNPHTLSHQDPQRAICCAALAESLCAPQFLTWEGGSPIPATSSLDWEHCRDKRFLGSMVLRKPLSF